MILWDIYWAKVLIDHPKNCDNFFVAEYFGKRFGTLNDDTIYLQSHASAWIWHSACSLRMRIHIKPSKCMCNSRNAFHRNFIHRNCSKWQLIHSSKTMAGKDHQKWWISMLQMRIVSAKINDCYSFATTQIYTKRTFYASRFSSIVFMCFRPPGILPYQFSCCYSHMMYLVHHTLNLNGIYNGGKRNTLPFEEKNLWLITAQKDLSQKHQHFFSIKNQWKKEWLGKSNILGNQ